MNLEGKIISVRKITTKKGNDAVIITIMANDTGEVYKVMSYNLNYDNHDFGDEIKLQVSIPTDIMYFEKKAV